MSMTREQILTKALNLPPVERAQLIEDLFDSFNFQRKKEIEEIWKIEIEKRVKAYEEGKLTEKSKEEVFAKINKWK